MSDLADMAPDDLAELVMDMLRESGRPMSIHAAAEALIAKDVPRGTAQRSEMIHAARRVVGPTLADLAAAGRVIPHVRGSVFVYSPLHATPDIEARVNLLEKTLGGRVVSVVAGGTDPVVEITAPLSRIEAIGR
jgi:hypothetical protein